jgi:uncharacterized membrane protein YgdD (TMEM256/DUF423 family)
MLRVGFEPTTAVFKRTKTVHALDRVTTVIGYSNFYILNIKSIVVLDVTPCSLVEIYVSFGETDSILRTGLLFFSASLFAYSSSTRKMKTAVTPKRRKTAVFIISAVSASILKR